MILCKNRFQFIFIDQKMICLALWCQKVKLVLIFTAVGSVITQGQAALAVHIVNQHNVCAHTCTRTHPHLIVIILAGKGRVRDQLWPNPRMHCTLVSTTSISFCPVGTICHEAVFRVLKKRSMKAFPEDTSVLVCVQCPVESPTRWTY